MSQTIDIVQRSLPEPELLVLEAVEQIERDIVFRVRSRGTPRCPSCSGSEVSYHSTYVRRLRDLPWQGQSVQIQVKTRRLRCRNRHCPRKIFAEQLPGVAARQARETNRLTQTLRRVGYVLGGLPGSRLLEQLGMSASRDTVLRRVKTKSGHVEQGKVRVLGVDDWAWRKQQRYGTMLMDLEQRRVVDLIPVRSATSFAEWLRLHPGVEMITRDRCGLYAEGGREGAPSAVQINDRYHLMNNLAGAVEREVQQLQVPSSVGIGGEGRGKAIRKSDADRSAAAKMPPSTIREVPGRGGAGASGAYPTGDRGKVWHGGGDGGWLVACARVSGATNPKRPEARSSALSPGPRAGFESGPGPNSFLRRPDRRAAAEAIPPHVGGTTEIPRQLSALLSGRSSSPQTDPTVSGDAALAALEPVGAMDCDGDRLGILFPDAVRRDLGAVELAIETPWNNGPIEGQINRLKVIKRQMYGRAGFELLKARVLPLSV